MEVANKFGMIQPGESSTKAVRAVFFVDPKGIIRAIIYYPLSLGRNSMRSPGIVAMQAADEFNVATPADWRPGDDVSFRLQDHAVWPKSGWIIRAI